MLESLLERFRQHDRTALARLLTLVARGQQVDDILAGLALQIGQPTPAAVAAGGADSPGPDVEATTRETKGERRKTATKFKKNEIEAGERGVDEQASVSAQYPVLSTPALQLTKPKTNDERQKSETSHAPDHLPVTTDHSPYTTHHSPPPRKVVAITGSGGVGKSTLIGKLIEFLRARGLTVAVLACDPQSPMSGGALLGDRVRMPSRPDDPGVFVRSLAAPSGQSGLAENLKIMIQLVVAFGFDIVIVETAGAGQADTAVRDLADVVVVLLQPETGDELQWQKAGLLEIADVVVIHKADLPTAEQVEPQVRDLLNLPECREIPVLSASAVKNQGLAELWSVIAALLQAN